KRCGVTELDESLTKVDSDLRIWVSVIQPDGRPNRAESVTKLRIVKTGLKDLPHVRVQLFGRLVHTHRFAPSFRSIQNCPLIVESRRPPHRRRAASDERARVKITPISCPVARAATSVAGDEAPPGKGEITATAAMMGRP